MRVLIGLIGVCARPDWLIGVCARPDWFRIKPFECHRTVTVSYSYDKRTIVHLYITQILPIIYQCSSLTDCYVIVCVFQIQTLVYRSLSNALVLPWPMMADNEQVSFFSHFTT